ncbi:Bax inhibitor 1 [Zancudomyces culisetae]|uniref:Bax inhibitor 1 n=1 Tax=Zancudomyces culisetae TaxID=1213189 RepID=A0A1R1PN68_ZANCU|nr:Bax inhibitor 1 [Zancudomyces culisetae]|eukprot:OMH82400.1 Bax inhibitor 1 [Zancudomyces culisetae]
MQQWVLGHIVGVLVTSVIGTLVTMLWLWFKSKSYPQNMILLGLFTIFEAMMIGTLLAEYSNSGNGILVLKALLITLGVVIGLTVFTMQSKYDFSGLGPILTVALFGFTGFMLVNMFIPFSAGGGMFEYGITIFGVGLFSLYLVYDTYMIMNKLEVDEYILGSLMLYLDIINIFLNILRLISEAQDH